jgi:uncharacterized membrane protein YqjE
MSVPPSRSENGTADDDRSLGELVKQLSDQSTRLARMEVELAKSELQQKGRQIGIGAGAFGAAALLGFFAFAALTTTLILALNEAMDAWLAALIVTVVYAAIAGVLALVGKQRVEEGSPPVPERAIETTKEDVEAAKRGIKEGRA